jgi:hypothetical protein
MQEASYNFGVQLAIMDAGLVKTAGIGGSIKNYLTASKLRGAIKQRSSALSDLGPYNELLKKRLDLKNKLDLAETFYAKRGVPIPEGHVNRQFNLRDVEHEIGNYGGKTPNSRLQAAEGDIQKEKLKYLLPAGAVGATGLGVGGYEALKKD